MKRPLGPYHHHDNRIAVLSLFVSGALVGQRLEPPPCVHGMQSCNHERDIPVAIGRPRDANLRDGESRLLLFELLSSYSTLSAAGRPL
jgi:hypothetical protein